MKRYAFVIGYMEPHVQIRFILATCIGREIIYEISLFYVMFVAREVPPVLSISCIFSELEYSSGDH